MARPLQGDQKKKTINISLDVATRDMLKRLAVEHHTTVSGLVVKLAWDAENELKERDTEEDAKDA